MNCSSCGESVPAEAGFCRNCGAILRGRSARATLVPSDPSEAAQPSAGDPPPFDFAQAPPESPRQYTPPETVASRASDPLRSGRHSDANDVRMRRRMVLLDCGIMAGAVIVIVSTFVVWYSDRITVGGVRVTATLHLLAGNAGIQRWLVPMTAALILAESVVNLVWLRGRQHEWRRHRGVAMILCFAGLVLVVNAMGASPFITTNLNNLGIQFDLGPGGWIALCGALVAVAAAFARMFVGHPAMTRSTPLSRAGPTAS